MRRLCCCFCSLIFLIAGLGLILVGFFLFEEFDEIFEEHLKSEMKLENDTVAFKNWLNPKISHSAQFYLFNIENPKEVLIGKKPQIKEIGPFSFEVFREKENIKLSEDKTKLSYNERKSYKFVEEDSTASLEVNVTIANVPVLALSQLLNQLAKTDSVINSVNNGERRADELFKIFKDNLFITAPVKKILFDGYKIADHEALRTHIKMLSEVDMPKALDNEWYSLFANPQNDEYEVVSGKNYDREETTPKSRVNRQWKAYGRIIKWNKNSRLPFWTDDCNMINGSDGMQFHPLVTRADTLYQFAPLQCRSIYMKYKRRSEVFGIPTYRFAPPSEMFYGPKKNQDNYCYCLSPQKIEKCSFDGILDLSTCHDGLPLIMSNPHFLDASQVIVNNVVGVAPNPRDHESFVDIEPTSGFLINAARRYQLNAHIKKTPMNMKMESVLKEFVVPVVWFEEVAQIKKERADYIKVWFVYPKKFDDAVIAGIISLGGLMMFLALCCCCCCRTKKIKPSQRKLQHKGQVENNNPIDYSNSYDEIFKGHTPLERLKDPVKRRVVRSSAPKLTHSELAQIPPPPSPPPLPGPALGTQLEHVSQPQLYLDQIKEFSNLKPVSNENKTDFTENQVNNNESLSKFESEKTKLLSERLNEELQKHLQCRGKSLNESYYRWSNFKQQKIIESQTRFNESKQTLQLDNTSMKSNSNCVNDIVSIDEDSEFSQEEENEIKTKETEHLVQNNIPMVYRDGNGLINITADLNGTGLKPGQIMTVTDIFCIK